MSQSYRATSAGRSTSSLDRALPWSFLAAFYVLTTIWGFRTGGRFPPSGLDLLLPATTAFALAWWAISDSVARGRPITRLAQAWFVLIANIVVPGYLIFSRGWVGLGLLLGNLVLWTFVYGVSMVAGNVFRLVF
jgi:hypothetical protein